VAIFGGGAFIGDPATPCSVKSDSKLGGHNRLR
jgi:hypothetical protein